MQSGTLNQALNRNSYSSILNFNSSLSIEHVELTLGLSHNYVDNILNGGTGNDIYNFGKNDGIDTVQDLATIAGQIDKLAFNNAVVRQNIAIYMNNGNLEIGYTDSLMDKITIQDQTSITDNKGLERFECNDGYFMTATDINQIISNMTTYTASNSITMASLGRQP